MTRIRESVEDTFAAIAFAERNNSKDAVLIMRGCTSRQRPEQQTPLRKQQPARSAHRAD